MSTEIESLVTAIESLRNESGFFKDYFFPLVSAFFSALLGAFVAYCTLRYQENIDIEKDKMDTVNRWTLTAETALSSLTNIKSNYHGELNNNPFERTLHVPTILHSANKINEKIENLSFIIPKKSDTEAQDIKWRNILRIRTMKENYNFILDIWKKRNEIERPIKEKILHDYAELGYVDVTQEQVFRSVGAANFISLIQLTEQAIKFTDDLILELNDFLTAFPQTSRKLIKTNKLKHYGTVFTYNIEDDAKRLNYLEKSPIVDFDMLAVFYGRTTEQVRRDSETGYEQQ